MTSRPPLPQPVAMARTVARARFHPGPWLAFWLAVALSALAVGGSRFAPTAPWLAWPVPAALLVVAVLLAAWGIGRLRRHDRMVRSHLALVEEHSAAGSWTWDRRLDRLETTRGFHQLLGLDQGSWSGGLGSLAAAASPKDQRTVALRVREALNGGPVDLVFGLASANGTERSLRLRCAGAKPGARRIHGTLQDVTQMARRGREQLARAKEDVDSQGRLTASQLKTRLVNAIAHELSTPLTPIRLRSDLLRRQAKELGRPDIAQSTEVLDRNVARLERFVAHVLDAVRADAHTVPLQVTQFPLDRVMTELGEEWKDAFTKAGVRLRIACSPGMMLAADQDRLGLAFQELLGNALRFSPKGSIVKVIAHPASNGVLVRFEDHGKGLSEAEKKRLFQPFALGPETDLDPRAAAGLGLFVVRRVVEAHGGRVWADSQGPGLGTTVFVLIPAHTRETTEAATAATVPGGRPPVGAPAAARQPPASTA